jgi:RNA polymerase sigma-70 factor (ECF subfamily)
MKAVAVARFCRRALLDGAPAIAWMRDGELRVVFKFTADGANITAIDLIGDPDNLRQLDLIAPFELRAR